MELSVRGNGGRLNSFCAQAGRSLVHYAAQYGDLKTLTTLLSPDNINTTTHEYNESPLYIACYNGHVDIVTHLLTIENLDLDIRSGIGDTALDVALRRSHMQIYELLLSFDLDKLTAHIDCQYAKPPSSPCPGKYSLRLPELDTFFDSPSASHLTYAVPSQPINHSDMLPPLPDDILPAPKKLRLDGNSR